LFSTPNRGAHHHAPLQTPPAQSPAGVKDSRAARLIALTTGGRPQWTPRDYGALASEGFAKNPVAYRCVRLIAEAAASTPLAVFVEGQRADDHPLKTPPRPAQFRAGRARPDGGVLREPAGRRQRLSGGGRRPEPTELYALRPDRMTVVPGPRGWPLAYDYQAAGRTVRIARDADGWLPVLHLKLFNPTNDHYGFSPLEAAAFAIDVHNASSAWNKALLDNSARPSGALVYSSKDAGDRLSDEQFDRLKTELANAHSGQANAGRPLLLEGGLDWRAMSLTPAEMDFTEGKHAAAREIALAFGVPPQLLGIPGDNTYANYREANAAFWRGTVVPLAERAARALTGWLAAKFPGAKIAPDLDAVPALSTERDALWGRLQAATFLTDAERRRLAGLEH
jgi:HK97 family phage portal protein